MQAESERTLSNLRVLGELSHNDKLQTNDDIFDIHSPTTMRALYRFWYRENRANNVQRVRQCVRNAMDFVERTIDHAESMRLRPGHAQVADAARLRVETATLQHFRMVDALRRAGEGLTNLLQTYRDDPALASQLRLIVEDIHTFTTVLKPYSQELQQCFSVSAVSAENVHRIHQL